MEIDFHKYPYPKMRHHTSANLYFPIGDLKEQPDNYPFVPETLKWEERFLNGKKPNILDIGCGKGSFLLDMSEQYPEQNIMGIEIRNLAVEWIQGVVAGEELPNADALWYSVLNGLLFLEDKSIDKIFYLFPDPWPKRNQHKRRAFGQRFLEICHRVLKDDGQLFLATDVDYVDEYQRKQLDEFGKFEYEILENRDKWTFPITNKEDFCFRKDIPVFRLIANKKQTK